MSAVLKPCPFCGGSNVMYIEERPGYGVVGCGDCCFTLPSDDWQLLPKDGAIRAWNSRAERTCRLIKDDCYWRCTECRDMFLTELDKKPKYRYCPNCGAKVVDR